jgi:SAM-dependent methyltransferase
MPRGPWNHNIHYHDIVLRLVPAGCQRALDVGCGTGLLARRLANVSESVVGIDADPEALSNARSFANHDSRIQFVEGDVMTYPFPAASFDFIAAVATLHHLPLGPALVRFRDLLRPGGTLAVIGLYRARTLTDFAMDAAAFPANWILRSLYGYSEEPTRKQMPNETLQEIRNAGEVFLPGAQITRLLLFRYSLIWRKP